VTGSDERLQEAARAQDADDQSAELFAELRSLEPGTARHGEARDQLVTRFLPVAHRLARRFRNRGESMEDLEQVATLGLINAVDRFDPARGTDFLSFAVPTVLGELRRHFRDATWSMRVPRRLKELHLAISGAVGELSQRLGRAPTPSEIAAHLELPKEDVFAGLEVSLAQRSASLDEALQQGEQEGLSLGDTIGSDDPHLAAVDERESLHPLLECLPERERKILVLRFVHNLTQTQIAEQVGVSQMHVSRLLSKTLEKLRHGLGRER
jgi:RNA polymerase sigma-B factor